MTVYTDIIQEKEFHEKAQKMIIYVHDLIKSAFDPISLSLDKTNKYLKGEQTQLKFHSFISYLLWKLELNSH